MGKCASKSVPRKPTVFELNHAAFSSLRDEAQAVFNEAYNKALAENPFAKNSSLLPRNSGIWLRQSGRFPCYYSHRESPLVLVVSGKGNRASDIALKATKTYLEDAIAPGYLHFNF